jgi:cobalamin biosynthesis protein CbiD
LAEAAAAVVAAAVGHLEAQVEVMAVEVMAAEAAEAGLQAEAEAAVEAGHLEEVILPEAAADTAEETVADIAEEVAVEARQQFT